MYEKLKGGPGIPKIFWTGTDRNNNILIMERLGPSLEKFFQRQG